MNNKLLIIAGALDGASGSVLSIIMSKAMNRSFANVLFGAFGQVSAHTAGAGRGKTVIRYTPEDAAQMLDAARTVIIVPGYGMAVAQAQHRRAGVGRRADRARRRRQVTPSIRWPAACPAT